MVDFDKTWSTLEQKITACRVCPRLVAHREKVACEKRRAFRECEYWGKPVPGFGDRNAKILVVGLAPGAHGSNRTGRMFTGDGSGDFLFPALFRGGFANQPRSVSIGDGMELLQLYITAVGRCAPPDNKPLPGELTNCRQFLLEEITLLKNIQGIVALGAVAYKNVIGFDQYIGMNRKAPLFGHKVLFDPGHGLPWVLASFHPSRQNTQTGRLTETMFDEIWTTSRQLIQ